MDLKQAIINLEQLLELHIGFHDYSDLTTLPIEYTQHMNPSCLHHKQKSLATCVHYCGAGGIVDQNMQKYKDGWIHDCPWNLTKISIPIYENKILKGYLFGVLPKDKKVTQAWLESRRQGLLLMRSHIELFLSKAKAPPHSSPRALAVIQFIEGRLDRPITLGEMAQALALSNAHCSHWISKNFGQTFKALVLEKKLNRAASLLHSTNSSITDIALSLNFFDQSHFSHSFKQKFNIAPLAYRRKRQEF